jgi:threonine/homoserine/homoserine lactone efflux protein
MGIDNFATFIITATLFIITPGIDTIFVLNKSISQGRTSGVYASFGVNMGVLVHTILGALGLSLIIAKSDLAFAFMKYGGAIYLIYLGIAKLKSKEELISTNNNSNDNKTARSNFTSGLITNTLNPKVALFFLAFFPQFILPESISSPTPFILLGFSYAIIGTVWFLILTILSSSFYKVFKENKSTSLYFNKFSGLVFILLAIKIVFTKSV